MNYFDVKRISNSQLGYMKRSLDYWKYKMSKPSEITSALLFGTGLHCAVLEPQKYEILAESTYKTVCQKYLELYAGELLNGQKAEIDRLVEVLKSHPVANKIFGKGEKEKELYFNYNEVECKAKLDYIDVDNGIIYDLKTTRDIEKVERSLFDYSYYRQAVFYQIGAMLEYDKNFDFRFIFISTDELPEVRVVELSDEWFEYGIMEIDYLLERYKSYVSGFEQSTLLQKEIEIITAQQYQINKIKKVCGVE